MDNSTIVHEVSTKGYSSAVEKVNMDYGFAVNRFIVGAMETARRLNESNNISANRKP